MGAMQRRALLLTRILSGALPAVAVGALAIVFWGPGKPRAALGARAWGAPAASAGRAPLALRIEGIRRLYGVDDAATAKELAGLSIEVRGASGALVGAWRGDAGEDGVAEALVALEGSDEELGGPLDVRVRRGEVELARGGIERASGAAEAERGGRELVEVVGRSRGRCGARVELMRGAIAAPFEEEVRVTLVPGEGTGTGTGTGAGTGTGTGAGAGAGTGTGAGTVEAVSGMGVVVTPERAAVGEGGSAALRVKALAHNVELALKLRDAAGNEGEWEGTLPVLPGAMWLDPRSAPGSITIVSPAPRERAYASLHTNGGRAFGAVVALARDDAGFYRGSLALPAALASAKELDLIVSGDPYESGVGTVAWPVAPAYGKASPRRVQRLLDGVPAAEARERERAQAARRAAALVIGLAAAAAVLVVLLQSWASQKRLVAHLEGAAAEVAHEEQEGERARLLHVVKERPIVSALLGAALIALGFALVLAFAALR